LPRERTNNSAIIVRGARQNNLKDLDLEIPLHQITVVTGVSGSGKSSLAFDTLYAEGQRRYIETFSPYARQFMERMDRPLVDQIENIPPAIAIDRTEPVRTSRSTVGTMTELTDYVKLLYARLGQLHCKKCQRPVFPQTPRHVWEAMKGLPEGSEILITFPVSPRERSLEELRGELGRMGFTRYFSKGDIRPLDELKDGGALEEIHVIADRLPLRHSDRKRVVDSLEQAFRFGHGRLDIWVDRERRLSFSNRLECAACNITYRTPHANLFSFNSPVGACETCRGFGRIIDIDLDLVIPDPSLSLMEGAIKPWGRQEDGRMEFHDLAAFCRKKNIPFDIPFERLSKSQQKVIIDGTHEFYGVRGFFEWLETKTYKMHVRVYLSRFRSYLPCPDCKGTRFKEQALLYRINSRNIGEVYALSVKHAADFFRSIQISPGDKASTLILDEIRNRLNYLMDVGLDYLTLDRQSRTLSGGEVERVALTSALGSSLVNSLYILDEPSIGLHPRDNHRLIRILKALRDLQNTVVVVEHDPEIIRSSDFMLDLGPGAGEQGGRVMYFGPISGVNGSLTGRYLRGIERIPVPKRRKNPSKDKWLLIRGASENNLKNIDVKIPLGLFVCLTGVSGSGKSTLAEEIIYKAIKRAKGEPVGHPGTHRGISGIGHIRDVLLVDQRPIGRTSRANILTYTKAMAPIRKLLAGMEDARARGMGPGHFSFNVAGGRCETCRGAGFEKVEMQFLSDVFITCPDCSGKRFKKEVLAVHYRGKNIYDILNMTVEEAMAFFEEDRDIRDTLSPLIDVGLAYIRLGQPLNTLSGGEAQRLKLSKYLGNHGQGGRLFIFDEPTTGLHFEDIKRLLVALRRLVEKGNTILVIEHNMDVVKASDWVIDLGPEGGEQGGQVVVSGPPEVVADHRDSHTGRFLKKCIEDGRHLEPFAAPAKAPGPGKRRKSPSIEIRGAREHNLKDINLSIPRRKLVVITGVSGSGKSSLVFDVIFAEGQRRYLESLAPYVRQYVKVLERPDVDSISGIPPTVAIQQRISHAGTRSTVATLTEIYHFLRLLFSKVGTQHCPGCNRKFHRELLSKAVRKGFTEARIDGCIVTLTEDMSLDRYQEHTIELLVGRLPSDRMAPLINEALKEGQGSLIVTDLTGHEEVFSLRGICPVCGIGVPDLDPRLFSFNSKQGACTWCDGLGTVGGDEGDRVRTCPRCNGSRLKPQALSVRINGYSIWDLVQRPASELQRLLRDLTFSPGERSITEPILAEIYQRLSFMNRLGLSYLTLDRSGETLSGGEAQRIRLAAQLGSNLTGVCYILDEPTIGLHPRDNRMLLDALKELKGRGNSVLVVEHDEETIREADYVIDLGPGPGHRGGEVVATGKPSDLKAVSTSVTGMVIAGRHRSITSRLRPYHKGGLLRVKGASENNLKGIDVDFPLGTLICLAGVSGSGKSTLLKETLFKGTRNLLAGRRDPGVACKAIEGWKELEKVLEVDHSPIGRTPRSVPASYVGFLNEIRKLFSLTPVARARGYTPGRFSFNVPGGRCEACKGHGYLKVTMSFLPDVYINCEVCNGKRFNGETLDITYKGKNISEVLELTFDEAAEFFASVPSIYRGVKVVCDIGLGYLQLGQASPTLSGGEAQRIKLSEELAKPSSGRTLYILDEPTTGLHLADIEALKMVLQALVDRGNTVAVIEHNMEIIKEADYIIDLGPEGGDGGGEVVAKGSPLEILSNCDRSYTARYLKKYLKS